MCVFMKKNIPVEENKTFLPVPDALQQALVHQRAGRLMQAEELCNAVLRREPEHPDALHLLGMIRFQGGEGEAARELIARAFDRGPASAPMHSNMGVVLKSLGRLMEAREAFLKAIELEPSVAEHYFNLANVNHQLGDPAEACRLYHRALQLKPGYAAARNNLGVVLVDRGEYDEAVEQLREALRLRPNFAEACSNLGNALRNCGKPDEAIRWYEQAVQLQPAAAEGYYNLGCLLQDVRRVDEARDCFHKAVTIDFACLPARNNLGNLLADQGLLSKAVQQYKKIIDQDPGNLEAHNNLGTAFKDQGNIGAAITIHRRVLLQQPDSPAVHSNLLLDMHYTDETDPEELFREHVRWAERHGAARYPGQVQFANRPDPERVVRVGYVSPDFCFHSVAFFAEPLLQGHDRSCCKVYCYSATRRADAMTGRLRGHADVWRDIHHMDDETAAALIREDDIDILVDLAGHTAHNRLGIFARRAAPVQATYIGYPDTTGLAAMDYRLVDACTDPPEEADRFCTEELVRLPDGFLCYRPPAGAPPVAGPPVEAAGGITFGSFNNVAKITPGAVSLWSEILSRVPGSRLFLKSKVFNDPRIRKHFLNLFTRQGADPALLMLEANIPGIAGHLEQYGRVDIALDTFPYNGTTTTCEALWMGVPVISLAGKTHAGRVGISLLNRVELADLAASSPEKYVETAVRLAGDLERLRDLRGGLRERMQQSTLTDQSRFVPHLEQAYRRMWRTWCRN